ncbi:MAG: NADH-quinone oxidoreductase subunit NuoH [Dehalococcoidia bacterium]|nr:NADH-quinone oxidoreductase subunit NuoH [Dehalococcoidia bacterium]|tara:strand:+ start:3237 stop:4391 length:1155 start_codon:yes stop_codon:yes gene_type:complete
MPVTILLAISLGDFIWLVIALFIMFSALSGVVLSLTWLERKVLGRLQLRLGPTRTGPMGLMQPIADALKLILKEDIIPASSEKALFWVAPIIVVISAFMIWVTIPGTQNAVIQNLDLGLFYIIAFSVVGILGLVLAGWGSANKYGTLGGLRAAAQLISYEIPIIMVAISMAMLAQSLDLREIVNGQDDYIYFLIQPLGLVLFFIAGLAEVGRTPFDIYFAESEIVGGPFVEYSGAHWSVFFLAEYINTFAIAALTVILFFGGWSGPGLTGDWGIIYFLLKVYLVIMVIFWIRGTFPRLRIDQLMAFAWKVMVPMSFLTIVMTAVYQFYGWPAWSLTAMSTTGLVVVGIVIYKKMTAPSKLVAETRSRQAALEAQRRAAATGGGD